MALSKSFFDDVKKEVECPVCQEQFSDIKDPKILKCFHTFCKSCLEGWLRQQGGGALSCPTCRQITECSSNNINSLPSNLFYKQMVDIVQAYSGRGEEESAHCGNCDERQPLKFYCFDCNCFLCEDCAGLHKKWKDFRGHHVKEIRNFETSDAEDYARRSNVCKQHKDVFRFFCEPCKICICRDCAILSHEDHKKISLENGLEKKKSELEARMREVQANRSRLTDHKEYLETRRLKINNNYEQATTEVHKVAERCRNLISQHEASVTEKLTKEKKTFQVSFVNEMTRLDRKLTEIGISLEFSENVLSHNNLPEILNVEEMLEKRLQELSNNFEPMLNPTEVEYIPNDVSSLLNAPGKLLMTNTDPFLSVAEGQGLTEALRGEKGTFTVITKDSKNQTTYSEIDQINVEINSVNTKGTLRTSVTDLKIGRYQVIYTSDAAGDFNVSITVRGEVIKGSPFRLRVEEKKPAAGFHQSTAARWKTPRKLSDKEMEEDVTQTDAVEGSFGHGTNDTRGFRNEENNDEEMASTGLKPQQYETSQKFFPLFVKAHDEDLQKIEKKFQVKVSRMIDDRKVTIAPCDHCKADEFNEACEAFINLYQKVHQCMKLEQFLPNDQVLPTRVRQRIKDVVKKLPVVLEVSEDRKHWQVYGEEHFVKDALDYLEKENLISRKSVATRATESWDRDEIEENEAGFENHLEHMLGQVKLSVLKGDITDQHVDVIVNAANTSLSHGAGVAGAIIKKGGLGIQKESDNYTKRHGLLNDGEVAMTGPGRLPCKRIIHAVGPMWSIGERNSKRLLKIACQESLETASISSFKSIAFPAISSGIYGMPKDVCAKVMFAAVKEYIMKQDPRKQTLTDIRFVNIDDPTVSVFKKEFINFFELEKESSFANSAQASNSQRPKRGGRIKGGHPDKTAKNKHETLHDPLSAMIDTPPKTFSDAVKGNKRDGADRSSSSPKDSASGGAGWETECPICLDTLTNARTLKCKHVFCTDCLEKALEHNNRCPVCKEAQGVIKGNQPHGKMDVFKNRHQRLPGYNDCGTITITYSFQSGIQGPEHPNPGQWYSGTGRTAYLPDNREGNEVLQLLRRAFDARLVFTIGTSVTTGLHNQVTWNDIHHKTNTGGGPQGFGYPDPDYLRRVKEDLAAKGIR